MESRDRVILDDPIEWDVKKVCMNLEQHNFGEFIDFFSKKAKNIFKR